MKPAELRDELREGRSPALRNRRAIASLALGASVPLAYIALWQLGAVRKIREPKLPHFDAEKVNGSEQAYARFGVPDAFLGVASYAATATLAAMGGERRAETAPAIPLAMAAKVAFDALNAGKLTLDQWTKYRSFCIWCLLSAGATFAMFPLAIEEVLSVWKQKRKS
jgi:uncharacterized membrane protein